MTGTRMYRAWANMKARCRGRGGRDTNKHYLERGISVCDEWSNSFLSFMNWSKANGYDEDLTIDRIDNDKGYSPDNCRWTDNITQKSNTRQRRSDNKSGYRGVSYRSDTLRYSTRIISNGKSHNLGCFNTAEEGAIAYNNFVIANNLEHTLNVID